MAKEIIRRTLCDVDLADGVQVDGLEVIVTLRGAARTVDLCERHEKEFVTPLAMLLDEHGAPYRPEGARAPFPKRRRASTPRVAESAPVEVGAAPVEIEVEPPSHRVGEFFCPVEGCPKSVRTADGRAPYNRLTSLATHSRAKHGLNQTEVVAHGDVTRPLDSEVVEPEPDAPAAPGLIGTQREQRAECPECGHVFTNVADTEETESVRLSPRPAQALGVHRAKRHGYRSVTG